MKTKTIQKSLILLLTSFIWGTSFVAQSTGDDVVGPYTFNAVRLIIGGIVLIPVILFLDKKGKTSKKPTTKKEKQLLLLGGLCCGFLLCISSNLQQMGMHLGATAGKAGFLTACYILIVPILAIFIGRKCGFNVWLGVLFALAGLYLLCCTDNSLRINFADVLLLFCALGFSFHILVIDYFSPLVDGVRLSMLQFFISGILSAIPAVFIDISNTGFSNWLCNFNSLDAWIPLLYSGVMSCGVAYTLQIVGQDGVNPTVASLLMSFESVFSVLAGWILLGDVFSIREIGGCALMFIAVILAQLPIGKNSGKSTN